MEYVSCAATIRLMEEDYGADYIEELTHMVKFNIIEPEIKLVVKYPNNGKEEYQCHSLEQAISYLKSVPEQRKGYTKFYFDRFTVNQGKLKKARWYLDDVKRYEKEPKVLALF